jgi:hypothetical protein
LFRNAAQRLSSEKCFTDYVQIFLAGCLAPCGARSKAAQVKKRSRVALTFLATVHRFENVLTHNFGASGIGRCNVRASHFRPAEMQPATGKPKR